MRLTHTAWSTDMKVTRMVQTLLAYLLLHPQRSHHRDSLAGLFWGEYTQEQARACLSTTLWRLRSILEPGDVPRGTYLRITATGEISFNWDSDHWLDVTQFEVPVSKVAPRAVTELTGPDVAALGTALQLYTGELLEGFYEDWALRERERLRALYLVGQARLMDYYRHQGAYGESLRAGQQILAYDPLREDVHREVMRLYLESGQRGLAVQQYEACRNLLAVELGVEPMAETRELFTRIILPPRPLGGSVRQVNEPVSLQQALRELRLVMHELDDARERLERGIQCLEQFTLRNQHQ